LLRYSSAFKFTVGSWEKKTQVWRHRWCVRFGLRHLQSSEKKGSVVAKSGDWEKKGKKGDGKEQQGYRRFLYDGVINFARGLRRRKKEGGTAHRRLPHARTIPLLGACGRLGLKRGGRPQLSDSPCLIGGRRERREESAALAPAQGANLLFLQSRVRS